MYRDIETEAASRPRVGRPRRGTGAERIDSLFAVATRVFVRDGYGGSSIDKVASEAGVSTRTIYERFKNKADLLGAVITRLVDRDMSTVLSPDELDRMEPRQALTVIGQTLTGRARNPDCSALFRILAKEAQRFPELAAKMREHGKARLDNAVAGYLRGQVRRGALRLPDPDRAASLFLQMMCGELHECLLFGSETDMAKLNFEAHVDMVVDIFLNGCGPRNDNTSAPL